MNYENLVLSGGGIRVIASIGALEVIEQKGILSGIHKLAGSSAGAIIVTALAIGYNVSEIKQLVLNQNFGQFKDYYHLPLIRICYSYGCCSGDAFYQWLGEMIKVKTGNPDTTLIEVFNTYHKHLVINGCCLNKRETHYYNYISNPQMSVRQAVRISMSIPGLFAPIIWNGDYLVDGGLLENYSIYIFDKSTINSKCAQITRDNPTHIPSNKTLGIKLLSSNEFPDGQVYHGNDVINNIVSYFESIINTMMTQIDRSIITDQYWSHTIPINTGNISMCQFDLSQPQKLELIQIGKSYANKFFEGKQNV